MSLLRAIMGGPVETKGAGFVDRAWEALIGGMPSKAGQPISANTALRATVALACCRVLAEGVAQVPLRLMREDDQGRKLPAKDHPVYRLLHRRPNDWMTSFELRETLMYHALLYRGGFAYINRVRGVPMELLPLHPDHVRPAQAENHVVTFQIRVGGEWAEAPRSNILHIRGPSTDGFSGLDMVDLAREALGLSLATEETHARFFSNGAKAAGLLAFDGQLKDEQRERLRRQFTEATTGSNAYKTIILDQGAKYSQMAMTGVDSQHLETRRFQIEEVCRVFRVFPQMVGYADKTSTYASAEQFFIAHVIHSLGPWVERWEQSITRDLLTEQDQAAGYYPKFALQGLMRGDANARAVFYGMGIKDGWLTRNDARRLEDIDPLSGLDYPLVPLNEGIVGPDGMVIQQQAGADPADQQEANDDGTS